jgi:hypothetical protein
VELLYRNVLLPTTFEFVKFELLRVPGALLLLHARNQQG